MIKFDYNADKAKELVENQDFKLPEPGNYRVRIREVEEKLVNNKQVIGLRLELNGASGLVFHDIWIDEVKTEVVSKKGTKYVPWEMTLTTLKKFWDSFEGIEEGDLNIQNWKGKAGAASIGIRPYISKEGEEKKQAVVKYFLNTEQQRNLPNWDGSVSLTDAEGEDDFIVFN